MQTVNVFDILLRAGAACISVPPDHVVSERASGRGYDALRLRGPVMLTAADEDGFVFHAFDPLSGLCAPFLLPLAEVLSVREVRGNLVLLLFQTAGSDNAVVPETAFPLSGDVPEAGDSN